MTETFGFGSVLTEQVDTGIPTEVTDASNFAWDEPTGGGSFPPSITPGPVKFRFEVTKYEEKDNGTTDRNTSVHTLANGKIPLISFTAHVQTAELAPGRLLRDSGLTEIPIRFGELSGFKSKAMAEKHVSSDIERAYAALGLSAEFGAPKSLDDAVTMIRNCGSRIVSGSLGWSAAVKVGDGEYEVFSSKPNAKRGEKAWPRDPQTGNLVTEVEFSTGAKKMAREQIVALYPPRKAKE